MAKSRTRLSQVLGLMFVGYALGILTAPLSGKQTRTKLKNSAKNSVGGIEKDLKIAYSETKDLLDTLAKENPKLTGKLKDAKAAAIKSQAKVKNLLSAIHGQDNVDEDLDAALKSANKALKELKQYIAK